jgi:hypothetical protein
MVSAIPPAGMLRTAGQPQRRLVRYAILSLYTTRTDSMAGGSRLCPRGVVVQPSVTNNSDQRGRSRYLGANTIWQR